MKLLGQPFFIQNTVDHGWLVTWNDVALRRVDDEVVESMSFTVELPRNANLSISEVQTYALKRAEQLLQVVIRARQDDAQ